MRKTRCPKPDRLDPLGEVTFLAGLSRRERNRLLPLMTSAAARPGQTIVQQETAGREFFIIVEGTATVSRDGRPVAVLGAGDHFGELALLGNHVLRTATVTATTLMRLEVLTYLELTTMLELVPAIACRLLRRMAQYKADQPSGSKRPGGRLGILDERSGFVDRA